MIMVTLSLSVSQENLADFLSRRLWEKEHFCIDNRSVTLLSVCLYIFISVCPSVSLTLCLMLNLIIQDRSNAPLVLCSLVLAAAVGLLLPAHAHSLLRPQALPLPSQPRQQEFHRGRFLSKILNNGAKETWHFYWL